MDALIVSDSSYGNTEQVADVIAQGLGERYTVRVVVASQALLTSEGPRLLVVGRPTQKRHLSPGLRTMLDRLPRRSLQGVQAVSFDTRFRMPRSLSGSAAQRTRPPAGCAEPAVGWWQRRRAFMGKDVPPVWPKRRHGLERLEPGELERARRWARRLAEETAVVRS
jgi:hypothetical protein